VVRDRPNIDELKRELKELGADYVFTETEGRKLVASLSPDIKLACNGVGLLFFN
jgi:hypothetical protein